MKAHRNGFCLIVHVKVTYIFFRALDVKIVNSVDLPL